MVGELAHATRESDTAPRPPRIRLLGAEIDSHTLGEAVDAIDAALAHGRGGWVVTPNLDILRRLVTDRDFAEMCADADLRLADGMPLVWASRLRGTALRGRTAGSDLIWALCERASASGRRVYFLGGNPGAADAAASLLASKYPGLIVAGTLCPALGFDEREESLREVEASLVAARPEIVFVALGVPKQERLIRRLRRVVPGAWYLGIGISFSFVSGEVARAPKWMQNLGLEWLHRLMQEPRRLAKRYLVQGLPFAGRLLVVSTWERWARPRTRA